MYPYQIAQEETVRQERGRTLRNRLLAGTGLATGLVVLALFTGACGAGAEPPDQVGGLGTAPSAGPSAADSDPSAADNHGGNGGNSSGNGGESGSEQGGTGDAGEPVWQIEVAVSQWYPSFGCTASGTITLTGWPADSGMGLPVSYYWEVERPLGPGGPVEFQPFGGPQDVSFLEDGQATVTSPKLPDPHQSSIVRLNVVSVAGGDIPSQPVTYPSCPGFGLTN